jgi:hypothetical protein
MWRTAEFNTIRLRLARVSVFPSPFSKRMVETTAAE